jgi:putative inorganic carbon (HCO3(-)) transporter
MSRNLLLSDQQLIVSHYKRGISPLLQSEVSEDLGMTIIDQMIKILLILLLIFTPIAFGSMEIWAFSLMELCIFLIIILGTLQWAFRKPLDADNHPEPILGRSWTFPAVFLGLFLLLVLFQMLSLPAGLLKILSPRTYALRFDLSPLSLESQPPPSSLSVPLSFLPFTTQIEFFKWFALIALFLFLLKWKGFEKGKSTLITVIMFIGISESLYGMIEFLSGHEHILYVEASSLISSVTGTFINRNYFAGYLLMVIPLAFGYIFYRESLNEHFSVSWYRRLSSLDGKTYFMVFGVILMILGLLLSASRMGILSLLTSLTVVALFFRNLEKGQRFSKTPIFILGLALLWGALIGLDAVISRFFAVSEGFKNRWEIWANTFQIIRDFPLLGSGLGTFTQVFPSYRSFHIEGIVTHAENDFLQLISEGGLVGTGLLTVAFLSLFCKAFSGIRKLSLEDPRRYIGIGGLVGIIALLIHSMVERNIQVPANAFLFSVIFALVLKISTRKTESIRDKLN